MRSVFSVGGGLCASFFLRKEKKQEFYSGEVTPTNEDNRLAEQWERMAELNLLCCVYIDSYGEEPPPVPREQNSIRNRSISFSRFIKRISWRKLMGHRTSLR